MTARGTLLALVLASAPSLSAQQVTLRFQPVDGMRLHRLFQVHTRVTDTGAPADREVAYLGGMSQVVTMGPGGDPVVHLSFDSLRARTRAGGRLWQESQVVGGDTLWVQLRYDERIRPRRSTASAHWSADLLTTLVTGLPGFVLPPTPIAPGESWRVEVPVALGQPTADRGPAANGIPVHATITLDSVVPRARDTLAYLSVSGMVSSAERPSAGGSVRYGGTVVGQLVWSTAWGNIVSAAIRTRVEAAPVEPTRFGARALTWERTIRTTVRP